MAVKNYDDLDYGDDTRGEAIQTVGLPHGAPESGADGIDEPVEGMVVAVDGSGELIPATDTDDAVGVLYTYQYFGDSSRDGPYVREDRDATVAVGGKLKVHVDSGVTAGNALVPHAGGVAGEPAGVLEAGGAEGSNFVALSDAKQQGTRPDGNGGTEDAYYAEVLVR